MVASTHELMVRMGPPWTSWSRPRSGIRTVDDGRYRQRGRWTAKEPRGSV
jgi:hypothetical protein